MTAITSAKSKLGFIGIGYMGRPIAQRLLAAGFRLTAYDRHRTKAEELIQYGGTVAESVAALSADAVLTQAADEKQLRLYWGWSYGAGWMAVDDARQKFPRVPVLHKLYVIRELNGSGAKDGDNDPCQRFIQVLVPALDRALFPSGV